MSTDIFQAESIISKLSESEQLLLMERLALRLRTSTKQHTKERGTSIDVQLAAMAADPEIRAELDQIAQDFAHTESDGL